MASMTEPILMGQSLSSLHKPKSCKRRIDFPANGASVSRRNARERNRVKMVNNGFATLRDHVPSGKKNKKLSKVETLKSAVEYIKQLKLLLEGTSGTMDVDYCSSEEVIPSPRAAEPQQTPPQTPGIIYGGQFAEEYANLTAVSPAFSVADSPTSSLVSDSSGYENFIPDESDLLDLTLWFS